MHTIKRATASLFSVAALACLAPQAFSAEKLVGWDFSGLTAYGASPLDPTSLSPSVTVTGLTRGTGVGTTGSAAANAWGGNGWHETTGLAEAVAAGKFATFSITVSGGQPIAFESIESYNIRRSGSGPATGRWQFSIDGGDFTNIGEEDIAWGDVTASAGNSQLPIDLTGIPQLQEVADGSTVTFRIVTWGATGSGGTWYLNQFQTGDDLIVIGTPLGDDVTPPAVSSRSPAHEASDLPAASIEFLTFTFNEEVVPTTGVIELRKLSDSALVQSFDLSISGEVLLIENEVYLLLSAPLDLDTTYYVTIPAGSFQDLAGNPFAGFLGNEAWRFSTAAAPETPTVVVNKYFNSGAASGAGDIIELLVIGNETPAATVDLRGMIVKDFSSNMGGDSGGKFQFSEDSLWEAVPVGTLIVLTNDNSADDTGSADFLVKVGLANETYFTGLGGTFDIATTDMVMIKAAGSDAAGTTGGIHVLAGGSPGSFFSSFPGAKLLASATSGSGTGIVANNSTSTISDFIGEDATGAVALTVVQFGVANSSTNAAYIATLRGTDPSSGDGVATLANATAASPFENTGIFGRGLAGQSVAVTINAFIPDVTLTDVTIEVPVELGAPSSATLSGPGAAGALSSVAGQTVTVSSASATASDALVVTLHGLSTPSPSLLTDTGNYPFVISTKGSSGTLAPIAIAPAARVIVPIEVLRDVNENGVALDVGAVVAVEGVATTGNLNTSNTQVYLQDETAGINLFSTALPLEPSPLQRGRRYAILGSILQFNGLTEIVPLAEDQIVDLGPATEPAPQVVTIPALLAAAEDLEGSLVTVANLTKVSGTWNNSQNVTLQDTSGNQIVIRIQPTSTALPEPAYPVTVTGVLSQFDTSNPFTSGYQIFPRDPDDLAEGTLSGYDAWAAANAGGQGADQDFDNDGVPNGVEYFFGETGSSFTANPQPDENGTITWPRAPSAAVASFHVETSDNLVDWDDVEEPNPNLVITATSVAYTLPPGAGKLFVRLVVTP